MTDPTARADEAEQAKKETSDNSRNNLEMTDPSAPADETEQTKKETPATTTERTTTTKAKQSTKEGDGEI